MAAHRGGRRGAADEQGRDEDRHPVDETGFDECPVQLAPPLEQHAGHVEREEPGAEVGRVDPAIAAFAGEDGHAPRLQPRDALGGGLVRDRDDGAGRSARIDEARGERKARPAVHHDAQRLARPRRIEPHRERRVISEDGPDPHHHPVALTPQPVRFEPRGVPGDPPRASVEGRDLPVQGHGALERHVRPQALHGGEEDAVARSRLVLAAAREHLEPGLPERSRPPAPNPWVRVAGRHDHSPDPRPQDRIDAGRGPPLVIAGLERDVQRGAARPVPRLPQRLRLGVRASRAGVETLSHQPALADDDGAHHGIGRAEATAALGQGESPSHPALVFGCGVRGGIAGRHDPVSRAFTKVLASKGWRSSSRSPTPTNLIGTPSS